MGDVEEPSDRGKAVLSGGPNIDAGEPRRAARAFLGGPNSGAGLDQSRASALELAEVNPRTGRGLLGEPNRGAEGHRDGTEENALRSAKCRGSGVLRGGVDALGRAKSRACRSPSMRQNRRSWTGRDIEPAKSFKAAESALLGGPNIGCRGIIGWKENALGVG